MMRHFVIFQAVAAMALTGVGCASAANASPPPDGQCSFVLDPPKVVQVSGVSMVLATLHPGPCRIDAVPNTSVVCLSVEGDDSAGQCASNTGGQTLGYAMVYYPYRPGATYIVKGQGCVGQNDPALPTICQDLGPSHVTL